MIQKSKKDLSKQIKLPYFDEKSEHFSFKCFESNEIELTIFFFRKLQRQIMEKVMVLQKNMRRISLKCP